MKKPFLFLVTILNVNLFASSFDTQVGIFNGVASYSNGTTSNSSGIYSGNSRVPTLWTNGTTSNSSGIYSTILKVKNVISIRLQIPKLKLTLAICQLVLI